MDGKMLWDIDADGNIDGGIFTTPAGNFVFQIRPEDRPIKNDAAGRAKAIARIKAIAELLAANTDKL